MGFSQSEKWWEESSADFCKNHQKQATGDDLAGQERFAWMAFARANRMTPHGEKKVPLWDTWPSDPDTFNAGAGRLDVRELPVKEKPATVVPKGHRIKEADRSPRGKVEIVHRNADSFNYIVHKAKVNTPAGLKTFVKSGDLMNFPIGSVEVKGGLTTDNEGGVYDDAVKIEYGGKPYYLTSLHIMVKVAPTPKDPYKSEDPSWFWATFEYLGNAGFEHVRENLTTYPGTHLDQDEINKILGQAGLGGSNFENYGLMGTQIRFTTQPGEEPIILGNTILEDFAGTPREFKYQPQKWTGFRSSCHTCHGTAAAKINDKGDLVFFPMPIVVGKEIDMTGWTPLDFNWAVSFGNQNP